MSLRSTFAALWTLLTRPHEFFDQHSPPRQLVLSAWVVVGLAVVASLAILAVGWLLGQHVDATTTVTTMEPWPASTCEQFREMNNSTNVSSIPEPCQIDEPKTKQVHLGSKAYSIFAGKTPLVFFGVLLGWLLVAIGLHVLSALFGGEGSFGGTLAVAGLGMLPSALQTLAVTGSMGVAVVTTSFASDTGRLVEQLESLASSVSHPAVVLVIVAVTVWQAWLWAAGLERARDLDPRSAKLTAVVIGTISGVATLV